MNTKPTPQCQRCGALLTADAPEGLCPRCLMALNLAAPTEIPGETGPHGTKVVRPPPPAPSEMAKHFPQLEILECLGRGGMGVVYKARQPRLDRLVALKIIAPEKEKDPQFAERFAREAKALARLNHPNIVTVYDFGEADGLYYLMMEFVDGVGLRRLIAERKLSPQEALAIVPKICEALQFAHDQGVVHRDIKPENVLLDKQGRVKIADFGIAKIVGGTPLTPSLSPSDGERVSGRTGEGTLTQDQVLGTPHYMAPEQVEHPQTVDHRADIYSLGVVFYEMLTGELPLGKFQPPSKKVHVDVRLDEVVLHALEKEPELRYQHASEVKTDLETIAATPSPGSSRREGAEAKKAEHEQSLRTPAAIRSMVKVPALGLIVLSGLALFVLAGALVIWTYGAVLSVGGKARLPWISVISILLLMTGCNLVALIGAWRMRQLRSHSLAVAGSILFALSPWFGLTAVVNCGVPHPVWSCLPGILLGLLFGIWSLVVLSHREVRAAFGKGYLHPVKAPAGAAPPTSRPDRFWRRFAVAVALVLLAMILIPVGLVLLGMVLPAISKARNRAHQQVAAITQVQTATNFAFGPVIERVVSGEGDANQRFIDFDTGKLFAAAEFFGPKDEPSPEETQQWWRKTGVDAMGDTSAAVRGLVGFEMVAAPVPSEEWDRMIPARLEYHFTLAKPGTPVTMSGRGDLPATFAVKSRENGAGLLQIMGFTDNPRGVRIRYRLVQGQALRPSAASVGSKSGDAPWGDWNVGWSVRLRADRNVWEANELPEFKIDLRKRENSEPDALQRSLHGWLLEVDGRRYRLGVVSTAWEHKVAFQPGATEHSFIGLRFHRNDSGLSVLSVYQSGATGNLYNLLDSGYKPAKFEWTPGKHVVRIIFPGISRPSPDKADDYLASSNPVEIEILPKSPAAARPENSGNFGPVIEKVVTGMTDLEAGTLVDWPLPEQAEEAAPVRYAWINNEDPQARPWMRERGIDAADANHGLCGVDLWFMLLKSNDWQRLAPDGLREQLRQLPQPQSPGGLPLSDNRGTYAFQTREGSLGVLQVLGRTDGPRGLPSPGVTIRYKLVQGR